MSGPAPTTTAHRGVDVNPSLFGRGLAVLRIFFGVILFSNGLAKLFSFSMIDVGPYVANLIDRGITRSILTTNVEKTEIPLIPAIVNGLILPNWGFFQWVITATELGIGALLILGLATRGAALAGLGLNLFLWMLYFSSNRWAFEQPHEIVPLAILCLVPAGRVWGLDARIVRNRREGRRWPF